MPRLNVGDVEYAVPQGVTVLQARELAGKGARRFCYDERITVDKQVMMAGAE